MTISDPYYKASQTKSINWLPVPGLGFFSFIDGTLMFELMVSEKLDGEGL